MREASEFETWMRTGRRVLPRLAERKFNPWHDPEDGRFTFAHQGRYLGRGTSAISQTKPGPRTTATAKPRAAELSRPEERAQQERIAREHREREAFRNFIIPEEGDRNEVYIDTNGYMTVGIGHKVTKADGLKAGDRITDAQKEAFFRADADKALHAARGQMREAGITVPSFLSPLASVNFQLGPEWNKEHKRTWGKIMP